MSSSTSGRTDGARRAERLAPDDPDEPHRPSAANSWGGPEGSERAAGGLERRSSLLLLASLVIVAFGAFQVPGLPTLSGSVDLAARGVLVLGLVAFGAAALVLMGLSPESPPAPAGRLREWCRSTFFAEVGGRDGPADAAMERRRIRLGWARMAMSLGLLCLLGATVLSLPAYSAAVLMGLAGAAGVLLLRSP